MGVKITGNSKLLRELDSLFGGERAQKIQDAALREGAKVFVKELKAQMEPWKDTGASIEEITITEPFTQGGERRVAIHWKGPRNRYRIIHLNEFGTVKNPNPAGKGSIARALRNSERAYRAAVRKELRKAYG